MKIIFTLLAFLFVIEAYSATCSTTTRTNYSAGQVLTSSALNADFNQIVSKVNSLDGGCVTDGTLEASALNASDFATVTNGIHEGCPLVYVDANTVGVGKCILSVNGNFVKTTTQTNVTWGCSGCASELSSNLYYVYAKTGSTGTSLNLLISSTAPGADGYDGSLNKIIGRFFNNSSNNINQYSLASWVVNTFNQPAKKQFSFSYGDAYRNACETSPCAYLEQSGHYVSSVTFSVQGLYEANLSESFTNLRCTHSIGSELTSYVIAVNPNLASPNVYQFVSTAHDGGSGQYSYGDVVCEGY
jgi:hypothetical protein